MFFSEDSRSRSLVCSGDAEDSLELGQLAEISSPSLLTSVLLGQANLLQHQLGIGHVAVPLESLSELDMDQRAGIDNVDVLLEAECSANLLVVTRSKLVALHVTIVGSAQLLELLLDLLVAVDSNDEEGRSGLGADKTNLILRSCLRRSLNWSLLSCKLLLARLLKLLSRELLRRRLLKLRLSRKWLLKLLLSGEWLRLLHVSF